MKTTKRTLLLSLLMSLELGLAPAGWAALATSASEGQADGDAGSAQAARARQGIGDPALPSDVPGDSKTVRMLLELQGAPPPLEGTERAPRGERSGLPGLARPSPAGAAATNPFGPPQAPPAPGAADAVRAGAKDGPQTGAVDWRSGLNGGRANSGSYNSPPTAETRDPYAGAGRTQPSRPGEEIDVRRWMPNTLIRFVRENREWVLVGSLVVLALVWLGASAATQRRR